MKMEGTTNDLLKLSSSKTTDTGGLTFGPAWLRQLSSGDSTKMSALPPSPGLAFQLAKYRYGREEMLALYEQIEKALFTLPAPVGLATEFEDLFKKDLQRPVSLIQLSLEEQKFLSTCVNSQLALNSYSKLQGSSGLTLASSSSTNPSSTSNSTNQSNRQPNENTLNSVSSRGGSNSTRGSRGGSLGGQTGGRGGSYGTSSAERGGGGGGRGRGRGRGSDPQHIHKPAVDEEGNPVPVTTSIRGGGRGGYNRGSYTRPVSGNWEEREPATEKKYSRAMADDNWRSKASFSETEKEFEQNDKELSSSPRQAEFKEAENDASVNEKSTGGRNNWRSQTSTSQAAGTREWPSYKKPYLSSNADLNRNRSSYDPSIKRGPEDHPEWLNDDDEENEHDVEEVKGQARMTFDDSGKFVSVKNPKNDNPTEDQSSRSKSAKTQNEIPEEEADDGEEDEEEVEKEEDDDNLEQKPDISESESRKAAASLEQNQEQKLQDLAIQKLNQLTINDLQNRHTILNEQQQQQLLLSNALNQNIDNNTIKNLLLQQQQSLELLQQSSSSSSTTNKNTDPKLGAVAHDHPDADRWFYLDPQNQMQGAFSAEQMAGWFAAGYFNMSLMVKRGCDDRFIPLGVLTNNLGRIPFSPNPPSTQQQQQQQQTQSKQQTLSQDQLSQQMQLFQQMQQLQFFPQNFNLFQTQLATQQKAGLNTSNLNQILQQLQQLQLQQKAAVASVNSLGVGTVSNILNELRTQQEALINQMNLSSQQNLLNLTNKQQLSNQHDQSGLTVLDPAILDAALPNKSIWDDLASVSRISPISSVNTNQTPPPNQQASISPLNNLLQQVSNSQASNSQLAALMNNPMLSANAAALLAQQLNASGQFLVDNNPVKDKIQAFFELSKKEEERRRKLEEEYQVKLKREEEEKRRVQEEARVKQQHEEAAKRAEEERVREELRKEQQKKKLEEIIKKQEEEKKKSDELKKKKEEEKKKNEELKKQKEEQKKVELVLKQQQEEAEKKRQLEQQVELVKKQAELERQKQKLQQEQLNNLQLPSHVQWAKQQAAQQMPNVELKTILEQQALEQKLLMEQMKQHEIQTNQQNSSSSSWSNLFRGQQQSPPSVQASSSSQPVSLASIQAEQTKSVETVGKQPVTMSQKIQANKPAVVVGTPASTNQSLNQKSQSGSGPTWGAWSNPAAKLTTNLNDSNNNINSNNNNNTITSSTSGFWGEVSNEPKQQQPQVKQAIIGNGKNQKKSQFPDLGQNHHQNESTNHHSSTKQSKKAHQIEETLQQMFLRNMTISDEFMKWCQEQLKDFQVELHIPTFVNFLREIETCAEIEDYVINYLGESKQAKDFAQQFFVNRESQLSQQNNFSSNEQISEDPSSQFSLREAQFSSKQKQKRRSKGQRLDSQLLGFTVQPDPNLKNRGDIDSL